MPLKSDVRSSSPSVEGLAGSANKSPRIMARENEVFACNFEIFSKTSMKRPNTAPVTILQGRQSASLLGISVQGPKRSRCLNLGCMNVFLQMLTL